MRAFSNEPRWYQASFIVEENYYKGIGEAAFFYSKTTSRVNGNGMVTLYFAPS